MILRDTIQVAFTNLRRRPVRTLLSSLGVAVGVFTMVAMMSLGIGVQREVGRQFAEIGLENIQVQPRNPESSESEDAPPVEISGREQPIGAADLARWRSLPGVTDVTGFVQIERSMTVLLRRPEAADSAQPVTVDLGFGLRDPFEPAPEALAGAGAAGKDGELILSLLAAQSIGLDGAPADLLGRQVQLMLESPRGETQAFDFTIAGITSHRWPMALLTPADTAALNSWWFNAPDLFERWGYDHVLIKTRSLDDARQLVQPLTSEGFEVTSMEILYSLTNRIFQIINVLLGSIGGLALLVASIGVMNTMAMAIFERTREIGVLKALGASNRAIRRLFFMEAGLIGLLGGGLGSITGWLASLGLNALAIAAVNDAGLPPTSRLFVVTWWLVASVIGFSVLISAAAGLYPAMRAARLEPVAALSQGG